MTLLHVMKQVLNTLCKTLTLRVNGFLLRFCIEGQEVAGGRSRNPLLDCKFDFVLCVLVGLNRISQTHECFGIEQIGASCECGHRIAGPRFI